jgi:hypothetical protein
LVEYGDRDDPPQVTAARLHDTVARES